MKKILVVLFLMVACGFAVQLNAQVKGAKKVVGDWKYEVAQAPYGYNKGTISIAEQKNVLSGEVKFDSGYSVKLQDVSLQNDTLKMGVYVESEFVNVITKLKGNKMEGTVDSSQGKMPIKADKILPTPKK